MSVLIIDCETVPLRDLWTPKPPKDGEREEMAPPCFQQIVCIGGLVIFGGHNNLPLSIHKLAIIGDGLDERGQLEALAGAMSVAPTLVTWNGRKFDMPVIAARSLLLGATQPWLWKEQKPDYRYRYTTGSGHVDLCDQLAIYGSGRMMKLDDMARACGIPGKTGSGADVEALCNSGRLQEIKDYCLADCVLTARIYARWLVLTGKLSGEGFSRLDGALHSLSQPALPDDGEAPLPKGAGQDGEQIHEGEVGASVSQGRPLRQDGERQDVHVAPHG